MIAPSPQRWQVLLERWRITLLVAVFALAVTRALAYAPVGAGHVSNGPSVISGHGAYISYWVIGWCVVGILAVTDFFTRRQDSITALSAMMGAWGASYLLAWVLADFEQMGWLTTVTYWGPALIMISLGKMISILEEVMGQCNPQPPQQRPGQSPSSSL